MSVTIVRPDDWTEQWRKSSRSSSQVFVISDTATLLRNPNDGPFVRFVRLVKWASESIDMPEWRLHWILAGPDFETMEGRKKLNNLHEVRSRLWTLRDWSPATFKWLEEHSSVSIREGEIFSNCNNSVFTIFSGDSMNIQRDRSVPYGYVEKTDDVEFPVDRLPQAISDSMTISRFIELF